MATLNIRNLPADVHRRLRVRAAKAGRSMEAEARAILESAVTSDAEASDPAALQQLVRDLYEGHPPRDVVDELIAERRREAKSE